MNGACNVKFFWAPPPGAFDKGQKVKYHLISITKSISKIFIPNFVCVLTNEDTKHIRQDFFCPLGRAPGGGTLERWGCPEGQKKFKHGHVVYQIDGNDEQNRMQVKFSF